MYIYIYMEVSKNGGTPNSWMVYISGKSINDLGVPPYFRKRPHM